MLRTLETADYSSRGVKRACVALLNLVLISQMKWSTVFCNFSLIRPRVVANPEFKLGVGSPASQFIPYMYFENIFCKGRIHSEIIEQYPAR